MLDILLNIVLAINGLILDPSGTHLGLFLNMLLSLLFDFPEPWDMTGGEEG